MTHYVIQIPTRCVKGAPKAMPTSFQDADDAYKHARGCTIARNNVSTRINDTLYIDHQYVVIKAEAEVDAMRIATTDPRYVTMRKEAHAKTCVED